jgi:hypothetical protein
MAEVRIPLFVPLAEVGGGAEGWSRIARVLRDVPDLTLVGVGHGCWGDDRFFRPLLERYPGLHIDISRYELDAGTECLVAKYGSGRLLFGSGHPYSTMGGPVTMLAHAPIADAARADIASGNLNRLLGWGASAEAKSAPGPKPERIHLTAAAREVSPLVAAWMAGPPDDCPVVDVHGHFGPLSRIWFPTDSTGGMLRTMDRCGVRIVISSHHVALTSDPFRGNATLRADALEREPSRFLGYYTWNPHYAAEQERDLAAFPPHDGFVGFKLHPSEHGVPLTDPRYAPLFEYANAHRLPVLSHTWGGSAVDSPELVSEVASRYSDMPFLMGHSGYGAWDASARTALAHPNVHLELCAAYSVRGVIEKFVREVGSERVLYGTDLPWFDPMYVIGTILWAEISDDDRRNILYRNAARLFPAVAERLGE